MRFKTLLKTLIILIFLGFISIAVVAVYINNSLQQKSNNADAVLLHFPQGTSASYIAYKLEDEGVINNSFFFKAYVRLKGASLKAGQYEFLPNTSFQDVITKLVKADVKMHSITIPEGFSNYQIYQLLEAEKNLTGELEEAAFKEGTLFPSTYHFHYQQERMSVLKQMNNEFEEVFSEIWDNASEASKELFKSPYEAVILASIIEKETGIAKERAIVASVFLNRLKKNMKLQTDPSVIYAVTEGRYDLNRPIYKSDLRAELPHNTYYIRGLPPTAIANAGEAALKAVFEPAKTDYLYFVASKEGGHKFARTLKEHNANVREWRGR